MGGPSLNLAAFSILVIACTLVAATIAVLMIRRGHRRTTDGPPLCGRCRYEVTGLPTASCPECGSDLDEVGVIRDRRAAWPGWAKLVLMTAIVLPPGVIAHTMITGAIPRRVDGVWTIILPPPAASTHGGFRITGVDGARPGDLIGPTTFDIEFRQNGRGTVVGRLDLSEGRPAITDVEGRPVDVSAAPLGGWLGQVSADNAPEISDQAAGLAQMLQRGDTMTIGLNGQQYTFFDRHPAGAIDVRGMRTYNQGVVHTRIATTPRPIVPRQAWWVIWPLAWLAIAALLLRRRPARLARPRTES